MEARKDTLCGKKLCRFCLSQDETLTSLYDRSRAPKNSVPLSLKILSCVSIEVFPSDKMPSYICNRCKFFMDISYEYKQMCRQADENVLEYIQSGTNLSPVTWPSTLQKLFRVATKSELAVMKTVIEGGATVQVTAHETDSEEEEEDDDDEEKVYNVKIGDGSNEGPKNARVKVITADKQIKPRAKQVTDMEDANTVNMDRNIHQASTELWDDNVIQGSSDGLKIENNLRDGCWACDECDCTYPLKQLLYLHKKNKHRHRPVQCDQCDAKFFNHYDLTTHQLRHAKDEMIFECVACGKKFRRLILLKRHEKLIHSDLPQLPCPSCPATFLSQEELDAHHKKHTTVKERQFVCLLCDKRFLEKATLLRHKANVHEREDAFACGYCTARFPSVTKLQRHVRTHAGDRSYPCKYCTKSFIKSHHYTRHLRVKHRETIRTCRGPFGESEPYRCEQCEDTFSTQDELIFHSAIHATQNLTCPLCQEKFPNVDAVTSHIKSHVNGSEFMCDMCELIFTTKEKLDTHVANAHDEEELRNEEADESSMDMEPEDYEDDTGINVKEEDDHMVVEIKKAGDFMLSKLQGDDEEKIDNTNSEESESEMTYTELSTVDTLAMTTKEPAKPEKPQAVTVTKTGQPPEKNDNQTAPILRRAEEIKRKGLGSETASDKKNKSEVNNTSANDKTLRLLEKELQELKRTNTRTEVVKTPAKPVEMLRNRRLPIHTSTPKLRTAVEEKRPATTKSPAPEKKVPERRVVTKENKEPKDVKDTKSNNGSMREEKEKEVKEKEKETAKEKEKETAKEKEKETTKEKEKETAKEKEKETPKEKEKETAKEKETPNKSLVKNGANEKNTSGEESMVRRSTRPSKIKDYAKMIRDRTQDSDEDDDSDVDEEYKETERGIESKAKTRRVNAKPAPKPAATPPAGQPPRKRGRPRKDATPVPAKLKKEEIPAEEVKSDEPEKESENDSKAQENEAANNEKTLTADSERTENKPVAEPKPGVLVSPTGQTLKKIPVKALPPGVKPLPLPPNARPVGGGEVCEMQIGKKVVKVQKIVMTKAEVEAMAKKGLVEMKDGTMVLKQGIKIPTSDPSALKSLVGDEVSKESPNKKATPSRCDMEDEA